MSKPIRLILQLLLAAFFTLLYACGKEETSPTVIKGKVTDKKTGEPIEEAFIGCNSETGGLGNEIQVDRSTVSNALGNYEIVIPAEYTFSLIEVYESGYLPKVDPADGISIKVGDINTVDVELIPNDAFLKLIVNNNTGQHDSIYISIYNKTVFSEGLGLEGPVYPVVLLFGNTFNEIFAFPSEENADIYWSFDKFIFPNAPFNDSIFLPSGDTTEFVISF